MALPFPKSGLYAVTAPHHKTEDEIVTAVSAVIKGGACVVQYREKSGRPARKTARRLLVTCHNSNIPLIINDDIDLAKAIGADGVHLGKNDRGIEQARCLLGDDAIIGISCYDSVPRAQQAQKQGATYVAFGRFFASSSKPEATPASLDVLKNPKFDIPVVAIGGITADNGKLLLDAGSDLLAVIDGVFGHEHPQRAAEDFQALFTENATL